MSSSEPQSPKNLLFTQKACVIEEVCEPQAYFWFCLLIPTLPFLSETFPPLPVIIFKFKCQKHTQTCGTRVLSNGNCNLPKNTELSVKKAFGNIS